ncbi:protocadherin Fat 4 [Latimeria chalumnae]|uniref:protocadherin Fat 4 n=1 Tax=Latimeria chalumnae TaxID=7897 RepID=UPI00313BE837
MTELMQIIATDRDADDTIYFEFVNSHDGFLIDEGYIKVAYTLDYENLVGSPVRTLEIRAYDTDRIHSSTATLSVSITDVNDNPPVCSKNLYVTDFAESVPVGSQVLALDCWDDDLSAANSKLSYGLVLDSHASDRFTINRSVITVGPQNLEYDAASFAGANFQHSLTVQIWDNGSPSLTSQINLLNLLDRERMDNYRLTVQAVDLDNDLQSDPTRQRTSYAAVTVNVLNVNDEPPLCRPAFYERTIYSTIQTAFIQLECSDKDSPSEQLSYTIVAGNIEALFQLLRPDSNPPSVVTTQSFQYNVFQGIEHPRDFELLIQVTDELGGSKARQLTSTATVIVHVVPWTTTLPTTRTTTEVMSPLLIEYVNMEKNELKHDLYLVVTQ